MNEQLNNLFSEWQSRDIHEENRKIGKPFIYDGAIDEKKWRIATPKILFLGKEAYSRNAEKNSWSLCELVREDWRGPRNNHWWNVSRWAYGIQHTTRENIPGFPEDEAANKSLFDIAYVNIKKSGGVPNSNDDDLKRYVESDRDLIEKQVELLTPDIIIFCSTWHLVKGLGEHEEVSEWVYRNKKQMMLDYYHPAVRWNSKVLYYALCAIYQKFLQKRFD